MKLSPRQSAILQAIREDGSAAVEALAAAHAVSAQTIRRDVNTLCDLGLLRRQHGGAALPTNFRTAAFADREVFQAAEKDRIARAAAALIPDRASVFLGIGTTTAAVARALIGHDSLRVVTNNLDVADGLCRNPSFEVILAGGRARNRERDFIGESALAVFREIRVEYGVFGVCGVDADGALRDSDFDEVRLSRLILENSVKPVAVADHTKIRAATAVRFANLAELHAFVTDRPLPPELAARAEAAGVRVLIAEAEA
ncbi:Glycerol-3-phosphate regulon repressor [uncultured Alphaproteobacteria bacterium]|uniref:Glycerol-3-phosphate regulon repressor n=1 Tax=uncultured Alphaproteobacteria bacterium TaxID=91750 RepID=A0A212J6V9_9PROT|nr:Glycerol-3-phosphate regulon repressor [uncultured Alphaproteobacteria bacterium]